MQLELRQVSKSFGTQTVLRDLTLALPACSTLALIGPSGGGKSTLLRLLAGLLCPDSGTILVNNETLPRREEELRRYRHHLGVVFQDHNLFPHLTALQNITLPLTVTHNREEDEANATAFDLLSRLQLEAQAHKFPQQLSGGQRQRVAIARALAVQPRLLLFDEPTSALDPEMTAEVLEVIAELKNEGRPLVIVTHAMGFARRVADQVVFLANGTLVEHGPSERFFTQPQTEPVQRFLRRVLHY